MKIAHYWIDNEGQKNRYVHINLVAETQKEASELIDICNAMPIGIEAYGTVSKDNTWAWLKLPMKKVSYNKKYFGNAK